MEARPLRLRSGKRRLLVISDDPAISYSGTVYAAGSVNRFWVELAKLFECARISIPLKVVEKLEQGYTVELNPGSNTVISGRRFYFSKWDALRNPVTIIAGAAMLYRDIMWADTILYRLPSALLPLVLPFLMLLRHKKKTMLYIVGDLLGRNIVQVGGGRDRRSVCRLLAFAYDLVERFAAQSFSSLATGQRLCVKYNAQPFDVNMIAASNIFSRPKDFDLKSIKLLFVGKLDSNKGASVLLKALAMIDNGLKKVLRLKVVGTGPEEAGLKDQARTLGIDGMVEFTGEVPFERIGRYYREADILILPSYSEGVPKVLYEAMAAGLAIIASNVGGVPTVTDGGRCALLVPPGSPRGIIDALSNLILDETARKSLVENGLRKVSENTMEKKLTKLLRFLKD